MGMEQLSAVDSTCYRGMDFRESIAQQRRQLG